MVSGVLLDFSVVRKYFAYSIKKVAYLMNHHLNMLGIGYKEYFDNIFPPLDTQIYER